MRRLTAQLGTTEYTLFLFDPERDFPEPLVRISCINTLMLFFAVSPVFKTGH